MRVARLAQASKKCLSLAQGCSVGFCVAAILVPFTLVSYHSGRIVKPLL